MSASTFFPFTRLPKDLRYQIYDHLCPASPRSYPYQQPSPISCITIQPPPKALLLLSHALHSEISDYYFSRCTFRILAQSFRLASVYRDNMCTGSAHVVRKMRRVELLLLMGLVRAPMFLPTAPAADSRAMSEAWLRDQIELLKGEAGALRTVVVSVRRAGWKEKWSVMGEMEACLGPLRELKGRVEFRVGEVVGPEAIERDMVKALGMIVEELNS